MVIPTHAAVCRRAQCPPVIPTSNATRRHFADWALTSKTLLLRRARAQDKIGWLARSAGACAPQRTPVLPNAQFSIYRAGSRTMNVETEPSRYEEPSEFHVKN